MMAGAAGGATMAIVIKAVDQTKAAFTSVGESSSSLTDKLSRIGPAIAAAGAALMGMLAATAGAFREYDAHLKRAVDAADMTAAEYQRLRELSMSLSDAVIGPTKLAEGLHALSKTSKEAALDVDTVRKYTELAKAAQADFATVVDQTADVLSLFGMSAQDVGIISDQLTAITQMSSWSLSDLLDVTQRLAPVASAAGMSINDLTMLLASAAAQGLTTRSAYSALNMGLTYLIDPTTKAKDALDKLNISMVDSNGQAKSADALLKEIIARFGEIPDPATKAALATDLFGKDAGPEMVKILGKGQEGLDVYRKKLDESTGSTAAMAKITTDAVGPLDQFKAWIDKTRISIGEVFAENQDLVTGLSFTLMGFGSLIKIGPTIISTFSWIGGAAVAAAGHLWALVTATLASAAAAIKSAVAWIAAHGAMVLGIFAIFAIGAAVAALWYILDETSRKVENTFGGSPMGQFEKSMRRAYEVTARYGGMMGEELDAIAGPAIKVGAGGGAAGGGGMAIYGDVHFNFPETPADPDEFSRAVVDKLRTYHYLGA